MHQQQVEGALLLFLFSLGHSLESYAMGRAKKAIEALSKLAPATAMVRSTDGTNELPVALLVPGDVVIVRPNDRLPADGFVVAGFSSINQAPVTGESVPVDKRPVTDAALVRSKPDAVDAASKVFAGTINGETLIEVEVTRRSTESTLARVIKMVSEAEVRKSPTQRFTDRFQRVFVPLALLLVAALMCAGIYILLLCRWKGAKQGAEGLAGERDAQTPRINEGQIPDTKKPGLPWLFCRLLSSSEFLFNHRLIIGLILTICAFFLLLLSDLLFVLVRSVIAP